MGVSPKWVKSKKRRKKRKKRKREWLNDGDNNGQATHGARKHAWRTQAAWANYWKVSYQSPEIITLVVYNLVHKSIEKPAPATSLSTSCLPPLLQLVRSMMNNPFLFPESQKLSSENHDCHPRGINEWTAKGVMMGECQLFRTNIPFIVIWTLKVFHCKWYSEEQEN